MSRIHTKSCSQWLSSAPRAPTSSGPAAARCPAPWAPPPVPTELKHSWFVHTGSVQQEQGSSPLGVRSPCAAGSAAQSRGQPQTQVCLEKGRGKRGWPAELAVLSAAGLFSLVCPLGTLPWPLWVGLWSRVDMEIGGWPFQKKGSQLCPLGSGTPAPPLLSLPLSHQRGSYPRGSCSAPDR